eukprot:6195492-Pleurochrysis_carterae.AAC.3
MLQFRGPSHMISAARHVFLGCSHHQLKPGGLEFGTPSPQNNASAWMEDGIACISRPYLRRTSRPTIRPNCYA